MQQSLLEARQIRTESKSLNSPSYSLFQMMERLVALGALLATFPLLLFAALATAMLSGRSPFIAHLRVGHNGFPLWVYKLRTMWADEGRGPRLLVEHVVPTPSPLDRNPCSKADQVTSRFAAWCRRYSIDELPQFWNVARGEMALIGPRPVTRAELDKHYGAAADTVLRMKPGLSGLWQISGRSRLTYAQRRRLDLFLASHWSLALYLRILFLTMPKVVMGKDAW